MGGPSQIPTQKFLTPPAPRSPTTGWDMLMIFDLLTSPQAHQFDPGMKMSLAFCSARHPRQFDMPHYHVENFRVAQSVTCLATDASLTADPGVASSIPARSHTFVEIDHEIISTVILLPSAESFKKGCCQLQAKVCARSTG